MLTACIICVIFIKRHIVLAFSLKIIGVIILINIGFISNQIFSEINETVTADIVQAISQAAISQYVPMGQMFTQRQWQLFKAYQIKFSKKRTERLKLEEDQQMIDKGFSVLFWFTELVILIYSISLGLYLGYPDSIEETCEDFSPSQEQVMWRASLAVEASASLILIFDMITSALLLYSMRRIYVTIRSYYPKWKSNNWFIALQVIAFTAPTLMCLICIIAYKPQINFAGTLTYREMSYYCLFQVSISIVMLILLYVVTTYSLPKP